jgi:hypothetical protein
MKSKKHRLVRIPIVALAAALSLCPASIRAQNVTVRAVAPVAGHVPAVAVTPSLTVSPLRVDLGSMLTTPGSLTPSAIQAEQPRAAAAILKPDGISAAGYRAASMDGRMAAAILQPPAAFPSHAVEAGAVLPDIGERMRGATSAERVAEILGEIRESLRLDRSGTLFTGAASRRSGLVDLSEVPAPPSPAADLPAASLKAAKASDVPGQMQSNGRTLLPGSGAEPLRKLSPRLVPSHKSVWVHFHHGVSPHQAARLLRRHGLDIIRSYSVGGTLQAEVLLLGMRPEQAALSLVQDKAVADIEVAREDVQEIWATFRPGVSSIQAQRLLARLGLSFARDAKTAKGYAVEVLLLGADAAKAARNLIGEKTVAEVEVAPDIYRAILEREAAALPRDQSARRTKRSLDRGEAVTVNATFQIAERETSDASPNTEAELSYVNAGLNLLEFKIDEIQKETNQPTPKDFVKSAREALARLKKDRSYIRLPAPSDWAFDTLTSVVGKAIRVFEAISAHTSTMPEFSAAYEAYMFEMRLAIMEGQSQGSLLQIEKAARVKTREIISRINAGEIVDPSKLRELQFLVATRNHWLDTTLGIVVVKYPEGGAPIEETIEASKKAYANIKSEWRENAPSDRSFAATTRVVEKQIELHDAAYAHLGRNELTEFLDTVDAAINDILSNGVKAEASADAIADELVSYFKEKIAGLGTDFTAGRMMRSRRARPSAASPRSYMPKWRETKARPLPAWRQPAGKKLRR